MDGDDAGGRGYHQKGSTEAKIAGATGGYAKAAKAAARNVQLAASRAKGAEEAKAQAVREAADAQEDAVREAAAAAEARAMRIKAGNLRERLQDLQLDSPPCPSDFVNASRDPISALTLLYNNSGLGTNGALFELSHCALNAAQRATYIEAAKAELRGEAEETAAAQDGIGAAYRAATSAGRFIYVCACCGVSNFEGTGDYRRVPLARLGPLRYTDSEGDVGRWERITRAHALVEAESSAFVANLLKGCGPPKITSRLQHNTPRVGVPVPALPFI